MSRSYVKMEFLAEEVFRRKAAGETNREIGEHFGLSKKQIVSERRSSSFVVSSLRN